MARMKNSEMLVEPATGASMKNNPYVRVQTYPNGSYSLTVKQGEMQGEYLYFTPEELAIGIAFHVADGIISDTEKGMMTDIVSSHIKSSALFTKKINEIEERRKHVAASRDKHCRELKHTKSILHKYQKKYGELI